MSAPRRLILTKEEREKLVEMRDHQAKPYLRERAAALLKIAEGVPLSRVAREGLLKPRAPATVREWVKRYEAEGLAGLLIRPGRGRKPAFFPSAKHG
ncbi:MAG: helix-turn-helix domain-containing protein [Chloroflexi bacterium]|nr:helix-turn-helix domain-containing protein [Chloroflexota bacterium]